MFEILTYIIAGTSIGFVVTVLALVGLKVIAIGKRTYRKIIA